MIFKYLAKLLKMGMCGIAGFIIKKQFETEIASDILDEMIKTVRWRGPDGKGIYIDSISDKLIAFAHCRLAIVDLSDNGKQPLCSPDGRYYVTYNGEIYNHNEIRNELKSLGHSFISSCDTEVLIHACMQWGVNEAILRFDGMWAFALYDRVEKQVYLCRDRMGVKPLYYSYQESDFLFASDMRSLYKFPGFKKNIDYSALHGYLWNMYVPAPQTILQGVCKLNPGTILRYDLNSNQLEIRQYWNPYDVEVSLPNNYTDYKDYVKEILQDSVRMRLEADVSVGVFLSGGIDSTLVASLAKDISKKRINTYSIGFEEKENDDARVASEVAGILGTNHKELYCTAKDALEIIPLLPTVYSEPFADNSQIPTLLLSKMTRDYVTVSLSGDGGDELFIGYPYYLRYEKLYKKRKWAQLTSLVIGKFVNGVDAVYDHNKWKINKFYNAADLESILTLDYTAVFPLIDSLLKSEITAKQNNQELRKAYIANGSIVMDDILKSIVNNSITYALPDDMLVKVDRASMYCSLECRCPLLDYKVAECAITAPTEWRCRNGIMKAPLRDILYDYIPKQIIERPKSGFGMPINKWLHNELNEMVNDSLSKDLIIRQGIFNVEEINHFVSSFNRGNNPILDKVAYTLLMFQLWWEEYMDGK